MACVPLAICLASTLAGSPRDFADADALARAPGAAKFQTREVSAGAGGPEVGDAVGVGVLHVLNRVVIANGKIAKARARAKPVRMFAVRAIVQHEADQRRLLNWLAGKPALETLVEGTEGTPGEKAGQKEGLPLLHEVSSARFDRVYLRTTIEMATRSLRFVDAAQAHVEDRNLGRLLAATEATLRRERQRARALLDTLPEAPPKPRQAEESHDS